MLAKTINRSLLPDFEQTLQASSVQFRYDWSQVPALWEEANEKHDRIRKDVQAGLLRVDQAQQLLGYPVDADRHIYLQPANLLQLEDGSVAPLVSVPGGGSAQDGRAEPPPEDEASEED
jgi:hypothetical protein